MRTKASAFLLAAAGLVAAPGARAEPAPGSSSAPIPGEGSQHLSERAAEFVANGRVSEAMRAYAEAIRLDPNNGPALLGLGRLRAGLGEMREAEELFSMATRQHRVAADAFADRAHLRKQQGRDAEALSDLDLSAQLAPDDRKRTEEISAWHVAHRAWLPALAAWRRAAAAAGDATELRTAAIQVRALSLLASDLDAVRAGAAADRSWTRRALSRLFRDEPGETGVPVPHRQTPSPTPASPGLPATRAAPAPPGVTPHP